MRKLQIRVSSSLLFPHYFRLLAREPATENSRLRPRPLHLLNRPIVDKGILDMRSGIIHAELLVPAALGQLEAGVDDVGPTVDGVLDDLELAWSLPRFEGNVSAWILQVQELAGPLRILVLDLLRLELVVLDLVLEGAVLVLGRGLGLADLLLSSQRQGDRPLSELLLLGGVGNDLLDLVGILHCLGSVASEPLPPHPHPLPVSELAFLVPFLGQRLPLLVLHLHRVLRHLVRFWVHFFLLQVLLGFVVFF